MPHTLTANTANYSATIIVPTDGDNANEVSVDPSFQQLLDNAGTERADRIAAVATETTRAEAAEEDIQDNLTIKKVVFTGVGDHNWVVPADCGSALGDGCGGGGGGGGGGNGTAVTTDSSLGGGGGAGGARRTLGIPGLTPGETAVVHCGAGGAGGAAETHGSDGAQTKISYGGGFVVTWPGGKGGTGPTPGGGGTCPTSDLGFCPGGHGPGLPNTSPRMGAYTLLAAGFQVIGTVGSLGLHPMGEGSGGPGTSFQSFGGDTGKGWPSCEGAGGLAGAYGGSSLSGTRKGGGGGGGGGAGGFGSGGNGGAGGLANDGVPGNGGNTDAGTPTANKGGGGGGGGGGGQGLAAGGAGAAGQDGAAGQITIYYVSSA